MLNYAVRAISVIMTALYTAVSIQACAPREEYQPAEALINTLPKEERSVVTILQSRESISLALQQAIDLYTTSHPQTQLTVQTVANPSDYRVSLRSRLLSGEQVDIFHLFGYSDTAELQPYLEDLSSLDWTRKAVAETLDAVTMDGAVYGIPYGVEGVGLIANRNIFEAAGIPLADIQTLEELTEAFVELQGQIDRGDWAERFPLLEAVTELPALDKDFLTHCLLNVVLTGEFASPAQAAQSPSIGMSRGDSLEQFVRLLARYGYAPNWSDYNQVTRREQVENGLAAERIAIILDTTESYSAVYAANPSLENRLALLPIPLVEGEEGGIYTGAPVYWAVGKDSSAQSKESALDFLQWLYTTDTGAAVVASRFGAVSAYRETAKDTGITTHRQMLSHMEAGQALPQMHSDIPAGWDNLFVEEIRAYLRKEREWEELMANLQEQWALRR